MARTSVDDARIQAEGRFERVEERTRRVQRVEQALRGPSWERFDQWDGVLERTDAEREAIDELGQYPEAAETLRGLRTSEKALALTARRRLNALGAATGVEPGKDSLRALRSHLPVVLQATYSKPTTTLTVLLTLVVFALVSFVIFVLPFLYVLTRIDQLRAGDDTHALGTQCTPLCFWWFPGLFFAKRRLGRRVTLTQRTLRIDKDRFELSELVSVDAGITDGFKEGLGYNTTLFLERRDGSRRSVTFVGDVSKLVEALRALTGQQP